jgi:hypothetical protein
MHVGRYDPIASLSRTEKKVLVLYGHIISIEVNNASHYILHSQGSMILMNLYYKGIIT